MKWPFDERPPHFTRDVVQPFSAAIPHCRCVLGASYTETERGGFREKSSVRSRRVELRPIPRGRCCTTGKPAGYCSYFTPSSSLIEQLEIDRSHRMTARAYSPPSGAACHLSLRQRAFSSGSTRVSPLSSEQSGDIAVIVRPER